MYETKLISARIDKDTLDKIEKFCATRTFWTRNYMINRILKAVMTDFDETAVYDMVRRPMYRNTSVDAKYEIKQMEPIK